MARASNLKTDRRRRLLKQTKGVRGRGSSCKRIAKPAAIKAAKNAFIGNKLKKRDFRSLWICRINAAVRQMDHDVIKNYSQFINKINKSKYPLDRKVLSSIITDDFNNFKSYFQNVISQ